MDTAGNRVRRFVAVALTAAVMAGTIDMSGAGAAGADETRRAADAAVAALNEARGELESLTAELHQLESAEADLAAEVETLRSAVAQIAVQRYVGRGGIVDPVEAALSPAEIDRAQVLASVVSMGFAETVERFVAARTDHAERLAELTRAVERRRQVVAELEERRNELSARLRALEAEQAASRASRSARTVADPATGWVCPVAGAVAFTNDWGQPRSGGRTHKGTDLFAPRGTPVVAPVSGVVTLRSTSLGGLSFFLAGDDGNQYFGTHMNSYGSSGRVAAGTVIGTVGNSGNARGASPHLHFEVRPGGGSQINPFPMLSAAC